MSAAEVAIAELLAVLDEERTAIRRLDAEAVTKAAQAKDALATKLSAMSFDELKPAASAFVTLRAELRRNGILLAHARSCLTEAVEAMTPRDGRAPRTRLRARV